MAIRVECKSCRSVFAAKNEHAGRSGKCPKCGAAILVPAGHESPGAAGSVARSDEKPLVPIDSRKVAARVAATLPAAQARVAQSAGRPGQTVES
ncbi:MAG TPA: hypothetical protein VGH32_01660, partial [Pirellulales bacterium]